MPELATAELIASTAQLVEDVRSGTIEISLLIHNRTRITMEQIQEFQKHRLSEMKTDPASVWIKNSPNAEAFTMGTLVGVSDRPLIPAQCAETVFYDRKAYLISIVYGRKSTRRSSQMNSLLNISTWL